MNIVCCHGVMGPDEDWKAREYRPTKRWKEWLQFRTEFDHDVVTQLPYFPHAHALLMKYDEWAKIMDAQDINPNTVLIGHSAGGGFVLKYLSLHPELMVKQVVLVAPWIDTDDFQPFGFYKGFSLNNNIMKQAKYGIDMMMSNGDMPHILSSIDKIIKNAPDIRVHRFENRGHFTTEELPEIMDIIRFD